MENKELYRGKTWIAGGVCAGLADHYNIRKGAIQAVFVLGTVVYLVPVFIYIVLWLLIPKRTGKRPPVNRKVKKCDYKN